MQKPNEVEVADELGDLPPVTGAEVKLVADLLPELIKDLLAMRDQQED